MTQQNPFAPQNNPFQPAQSAAAPAPAVAPQAPVAQPQYAQSAAAPAPAVAPQAPVAQPAAAAPTTPPPLPDFQNTGAGLDDPKLSGHGTPLFPLVPADMQVDIVNVYEAEGHESGKCTHYVFEVVASSDPANAPVGSKHRVFYRQEGSKNLLAVHGRLRGEVVCAIWGRNDPAFGKDAAEKWLLDPAQQAAFDAGTLRLPVSLRTYMVPKKDVPGEYHRNEAWSAARR